MRAVIEKPHDAVVKFDTYRNVQQHRTALVYLSFVSAVRTQWLDDVMVKSSDLYSIGLG